MFRAAKQQVSDALLNAVALSWHDPIMQAIGNASELCILHPLWNVCRDKVAGKGGFRWFRLMALGLGDADCCSCTAYDCRAAFEDGLKVVIGGGEQSLERRMLGRDQKGVKWKCSGLNAMHCFWPGKWLHWRRCCLLGGRIKRHGGDHSCGEQKVHHRCNFSFVFSVRWCGVEVSCSDFMARAVANAGADRRTSISTSRKKHLNG